MNYKKMLSSLLAFILVFSFFALLGPQTMVYGENIQISDDNDSERMEEVVARAFDKDILLKDIYLFKTNIMYTYLEAGYDVSSPEISAFIEREAIEIKIQSLALEIMGEELGVYPFSEEKNNEVREGVTTAFENLIEAYMLEFLENEDPSDDEKKEARALAEEMVLGELYDSKEDFIRDLIVYQKDNELFNLLFEKLTEDVDISEDEISLRHNELAEEDKEAYEDSIYNYEIAQRFGETVYYRPSGFRSVLHILLEVDEQLLSDYLGLQAQWEEQSNKEQDETETEDDGETEDITIEQVKEAEKAVLQSVQATIDEVMGKFDVGTSFVDLIDEYGTDPGMETEEMKAEGYAVHIESALYDPAFVAGAFSDSMTKVGDISEPVIGQYGVHIIYYLKDLEEGALSLDDIGYEEVKNQVLSEKSKEIFSDAMIEVIEKGEIEYFDLYEILLEIYQNSQEEDLTDDEEADVEDTLNTEEEEEKQE